MDQLYMIKSKETSQTSYKWVVKSDLTTSLALLLANLQT